MDDRPLIIGHGEKSMFSKKNRDRVVEFGGLQKRISKPREMVDVYIGSTLVKAMPLLLLVRFSKAAARAFPKPADPTDDLKAQPMNSLKESDKPHKFNEEVKTGEVKTEELSSSSEAATDGPVIVNGSGPVISKSPKPSRIRVRSSQSTASPKKSPNKRLALEVPDVATPPSTTALLDCLAWMSKNKDVHKGQNLHEFDIPGLDRVPLTTLVDLYAAVLQLDLRPLPNDLRVVIIERLSANPPLAFELQFIHEHIPIQDAVVTRAITAYYEHREADQYSELENSAIHQYVESTDAFLNRFVEIENARWARTQGRQNSRSRGKMQRAREDAEGTNEGAEGNSGSKPRSKRVRNRRKEKGNGQVKPLGNGQTGAQAVHEKEEVAE